MLQLSQCKIPYRDDSPEELRKRAAKQLRVRPEELADFQIVRRSVDARKKPDVFYIYTVRFSVHGEEAFLRKNRGNRNLHRVESEPSLKEKIKPVHSGEKIVVVGSGPAGLFCAYYLSLCGCRPVLIERGAPMEERTLDVESFWRRGVLDPESHVSFGEGGAGTFSDGKLNTGVKDRTGKKRFVLESFVKFGARRDILYDAKPHIGTDVLREVIVNMRREMIRHGCEFHFHTKLVGLEKSGGRLTGIRVEPAGEERILPCDRTLSCSRTLPCDRTLSCDRAVLAIGHSARDTFAMLRDSEVAMSAKPFAVGVRVQHLQEDIDRTQYGIADDRLPAAAYKCTGKTKDGRGVYSFCMCPGGYVVNASSEPGCLTVNGMSDADRDSGYANSAVVVTVDPSDFGGDDCLAGVEFQRRIEEKMYRLCGGRIPVQRYGDFVRNRATKECGRVTPCARGAWECANLRKALPKFVADGMIDGMEQFQEKMPGFAEEDTLLLGAETRTSSPVRIERNEELVSGTLDGLYPCGEGAGYAGGIMSAAMDGLRVAMKIQEKLIEEESR